MDKLDVLSEEIVIVGSRHGELADVVIPIYEKGEPMEVKDIREFLGDNEVIISPEDNPYDAYAVGVYKPDLKLIGHVWMCQSPGLRQWLKERGRTIMGCHHHLFQSISYLFFTGTTAHLHQLSVRPVQ